MTDSLNLDELMCKWTSDFDEDATNKQKPSYVKISEKKRVRSAKSRHANLRPQYSSRRNVDSILNTRLSPTIRDLCDADKARIAELIKELGKITSQKDEILSKMKSEKETYENQLNSLSSEKQSLMNEQTKLQEKLSKTETELATLQRQLSEQIVTLTRQSRYNTCPCLCVEAQKQIKTRTFTEQIDAELRRGQNSDHYPHASAVDLCNYKDIIAQGHEAQDSGNHSLKFLGCVNDCSSPAALNSRPNFSFGPESRSDFECNCNCPNNDNVQARQRQTAELSHPCNYSNQAFRCGHTISNALVTKSDTRHTFPNDKECYVKCPSPVVACCHHAMKYHPSCTQSHYEKPRSVPVVEGNVDPCREKAERSYTHAVDSSTPIHITERPESTEIIPSRYEMRERQVKISDDGDDDDNSELTETPSIVKKLEIPFRSHSVDLDQRIAEIDARHSQSHRELLMKEREVLERERRCLELLLEQRQLENGQKSASVPNTQRSRVIRPQSAHSVHSVVVKPGLLNRCDSPTSSQTPSSLCESVNIQLPETEEETTTMSPKYFVRGDRYSRRPGRSPPSPPSSILDIVESMNGGDRDSEEDEADDENRLFEDVFFVKLL